MSGPKWCGTAVWLAGALLGTAGCASMRMVPPQDVAQASDVFEATGRSSMSGSLVDESFTLGPYRVAGVERDWESAQGTTLGAYSRDDVQSGFGYRFEEGAETLAGRCGTLTTSSSYTLGKNALSSQEYHLVCTCGAGDGAPTLELRGKGAKATGRVSLARGTLDLTSVHEVDGAWPLMEPAGYRVGKQGEATLAAVEVLRPGRVWLSRALDGAERRQLGCLLAGLMLHEVPAER